MKWIECVTTPPIPPRRHGIHTAVRMMRAQELVLSENKKINKVQKLYLYRYRVHASKCNFANQRKQMILHRADILMTLLSRHCSHELQSFWGRGCPVIDCSLHSLSDEFRSFIPSSKSSHFRFTSSIFPEYGKFVFEWECSMREKALSMERKASEQESQTTNFISSAREFVPYIDK